MTAAGANPWLHDRCVVGHHDQCPGGEGEQGCDCGCHFQDEAGQRPELSRGERLVASVQRSYERHRRPRPVHPVHIEAMAERMCDSRRERTVLSIRGVDGPRYERAVRAHARRRLSLRRLAYALERQAGGGRR